jgi:hypothetical protein
VFPLNGRVCTLRLSDTTINMENSYKMLNSLTNINDFILYLRNLLIPTRRHVALYLLFTYMAAFRYVISLCSVERCSGIVNILSVIGYPPNRIYSFKKIMVLCQLGVFEQFYFKNRPYTFLCHSILHTAIHNILSAS